MNLAAVVLAAGAARRFGSDKLSAPFDGEPLVHHAIRAARAAPVRRVVVVAHPTLDTGDWPGAPVVNVVRRASAALSDTLRVGIEAVGTVDGVFIFLGDMPLVPHEVAHRLSGLLGHSYAVVPSHDGTPGHPVLLSSRAMADARELEGDAGAGKLLRSRKDVVFDAWPDTLIHVDVDRPEDLGLLTNRERPGR